MNLGGFIDTFKDAIARRVVESYPPLYRPSENGGRLPRLLRKPLGAQADAIRGAALRLRLSPLAGRQVRAGPLPACGLHQAQDEGLLRPADRRRGA